MSFYDDSSSTWSTSGRQSSWEHQQQSQPSRSTTASSLSQHAEPMAFAAQFEEIDRATDNLMKSGKWMPAPIQPPAGAAGAGRRESLPTPSAQPHGRGLDYAADPRSGPSSRHASVSEFSEGGARPGSAGLQGFYAGQRFPGSRQSEAEQVLQAKRRMAAQRERELRNYHQEQQYNRTTAVSGTKPDRAMSPTTMSEEDRRDLIARQHRALYGDGSSLYTPESPARSASQDVRAGGRGPSPLAFDPFGSQHATQGGAESSVQMPPRDRPDHSNSVASSGNSASLQPGQSSQPSAYGLSATAQQARATSSSPVAGSSPPLGQGPHGKNLASSASTPSGVAPIGTRPGPPGVQGNNGGNANSNNKRSTTPLTPSSLSYGFNANDKPTNPASGAINAGLAKDERSTSAASNPAAANEKAGGVSSGLGGAWAAGSTGVWGSGKGALAVQPSVWG